MANHRANLFRARGIGKGEVVNMLMEYTAECGSVTGGVKVALDAVLAGRYVILYGEFRGLESPGTRGVPTPSGFLLPTPRIDQ